MSCGHSRLDSKQVNDVTGLVGRITRGLALSFAVSLGLLTHRIFVYILLEIFMFHEQKLLFQAILLMKSAITL